KVVALVLHSIAILCTIFRLAYRGWMHHLWWEDAWAAFSLIGDVVCLVCIWVDSWLSPLSNGAFRNSLSDFIFPTHWYRAARMSIIFSIIRITNHPSLKIHRQIAYLIAVSFACTWVALLAHRITMCALHSCNMSNSLALSLLITDVTSDISLVAAPLYLWRNVGLSRSTKKLVLSAFGASLLNTVVTIPHCIIILKVHKIGETIIVVAHSALSLIICDLLVIVTFMYRVFWKETFDLDQSCEVFTSVVLMQTTCTTNTGTLPTSTETEAIVIKENMEDTRAVTVC
ncbi:hypothetical protein BDR04DRAFT_1025205, partial [Suillus decipiens]